VEVIAVTAGSGYDANQRDAGPNSPSASDERELPATVTLLVSPEQSKALAELESDGKLHLSLVYRGTPANAAKFIETQDKIIDALYPKEQTEESSSEHDPQKKEKINIYEVPMGSEVQ